MSEIKEILNGLKNLNNLAYCLQYVQIGNELGLNQNEMVSALKPIQDLAEKINQMPEPQKRYSLEVAAKIFNDAVAKNYR